MRFLALDGWRGIAAILVALYHLDFYNHLHDLPFLRNSYLFVDFFFVLSGFVISHAYQNKLSSFQRAKEFIIFRIARLWPLHIFILFLFIILELVKLLILQNTGEWNAYTGPFTNEYSLHSIASNIFLLQSINLYDGLTWNYPSWSISVEFYTYLVFMLFTLITHHYKSLIKPLNTLLISASILILFLSVDNLDDATYNNGIFRCILGFFLGGLCYKLFMSHSEKTPPYPSLLEIITLIFIILFIQLFGGTKYSLLSPFIFATAVFIFAFEGGVVSKLLRINVIQKIGTWSYSIYMLHALILLLIDRFFSIIEKTTNKALTIEHTVNDSTKELYYLQNPYVMDLLTLAYLLSLIVAASLSYRYIEQKGNLLIKKALTKKNTNTNKLTLQNS